MSQRAIVGTARGVAVVAAAAMLVAGCEFQGFRGRQLPQPPPSAEAEPPADEMYDMGKASVVGEGGASSGVAAAQLWKDRYTETVEKLLKANLNCRDMELESRDLKAQVAALDGKVRQAEKELAESNAMLREMGGELDNWKRNVTGFQEEMRKSRVAELRALQRILRILDASMPEERASAVAGTAVGAAATGGGPQ